MARFTSHHQTNWTIFKFHQRQLNYQTFLTQQLFMDIPITRKNLTTSSMTIALRTTHDSIWISVFVRTTNSGPSGRGAPRGRAGRGRGGRGRGGKRGDERPKVTEEDLDAQMEDYQKNLGA